VGRRDLVGRTELVGGEDSLDDLFSGRRIVGGEDGLGAVAEQELRMRGATAVVDEPPTRSRRLPVGFPSTVVALGGGIATVNTQPQILYRGERLIIPSSIAVGLLINDIKIGNRSQLAAANPMPAEAWTEKGWGVDMTLDTADVSQFISLLLQNTTGANITFVGMFLGRAVE
jgi:hypothetical protein